MLALGSAMLGGAFLGGSRGLAQEASPPRPSHIHNGDCDELGEVIQPLTALTVPTGQTLGNSDAVVAEAAFTSIPQTLDELLSSDHALKVHLSKAEIQTYLACGDIGGALDANGALIVGLKELDNSGYTGIAYLQPAGNGTTSVSVMIAKVVPVGNIEPQPAATAQAEAADSAPAADAAPAIVNVALSNFVIDMPTDIPAGPVRFSITNNGPAPHNFVIEGQGVNKKLANNLEPGQSGFLNVDLAPGTYTVFCPVGEGAHRAKGMEVTLTVS
jgi:plastocyanin